MVKLKKKKVLVVSPDIAVQTHVADTFMDSMYDIYFVLHAEDAVTVARRERIDLCMLDMCNKPDFGCTVLRRFSQDNVLQHIPIIFLTDDAGKYMTSPGDREILLSKVTKYAGAVKQDKPTVVLIEDEEDVLKILTFMFIQWGFNVLAYKNGEAGLKSIREHFPALVILDLCLPTIQGEEVCRQIRDSEATEHIPIIMLTAKDTDVDRIVGKVLGANLYITKPFDAEELFQNVTAVMKASVTI